MKPPKCVVHVLLASSTNLVRAKAISAAFAILLRVRLSLFPCVYPSDVQKYQAIKDQVKDVRVSARYESYDALVDLLESRVHRTLPESP
jgi:hypothetical protein